MPLSAPRLPEENACGCVDLASDAYECACRATGLVQTVGRKYALRLIVLIGENGPTRFKDLIRAMDNISPSTLTIRLAELEAAGLIQRVCFAEASPRTEYTLTKRGAELRKSLFALSRFANR